MLHPLNPPCSRRELGFLIGLQRKTLEFSCTFKTYNDADYARFVGVDFVTWLNSRRHTTLDQDKSVRKFFRDMPGLLRCDPALKNQVLSDFIHDQSFYRFFTDPTFHFLFAPSKSPAHAETTKILIYFYDFLGIAGYPAKVMSHILGSVKGFCKNDVVEGFEATNPGIQYVCPCCDNAFTDSGNGNAKGYTLEHYFPKSLYPSICLHPYNLIPMCSKCNDVKGQNDPLSPKDHYNTLHTVSYADVFHPIYRPVRSIAELLFRSTSGGEVMYFASKDSLRPLNPSITAYELLYDIPPRWKTLWKRVDKRVDDEIKRALKSLARGQAIDPGLFDRVLQVAIEELENQCGSEYLSYPAFRWLSWARINKFTDLYSSFSA